MRRAIRFATLLALAILVPPAIGAESPLEVYPPSVSLDGRLASQQLLITETAGDVPVDRTREAVFRSETPDIVTVDAAGRVSAVGDGAGRVSVEVAGQQMTVPIEVSGTTTVDEVDFERDIIPILTRFGCNSGPCHGKARGQNGFQLSLLGFDPKFDHDALTHEARGRRIFLADPSQSLLLQKPAGQTPHGGGIRLDPSGSSYQTLLSWVEAGAPAGDPEVPALVEVTVHPSERSLAHNSAQQLVVTAKYADGSTRDVTRLAAFQSNESGITAVNDDGLVESDTVVGDAAVMARYMGHIAVCNVAVPMQSDVPADLYANLPRYNFVDGHVWTKLQRLKITPSQQAADHKFVRRAYLDVIGRPPRMQEAREFLADESPDKRDVLIDRLLEEPEFPDYWANKWVDLLRPNPYRVGIKAVFNYDAWIRDAFRKNKPYDQFVRELITARGSTFRNGNVTMFRDRRDPAELTTITSQLFLGIRLECAKCHHHPFEVWGQEHFYSFAAYFARVGRKGTGLSPPISGSEEMFFNGNRGSVQHPLTGETMSPAPLFGTAREPGPNEDPREVLADWMTSPENPYFAQVMANRVWADIMGRGLVEPVDDFRATNPPSNAPLLVELGRDFRESGFDLKHLIRRICTSYVYGLSSLPNDRNVADTRNYSRHYRQRLRAESLLDGVVEITGSQESFRAMPSGSRATEIWTHRIDSIFLDTFGRPDPNQDPPCERTTDTSVVQALHLMNAENLYEKVTSDEGRAAALAASDMGAADIVDELYLAIYSRFPTAEETAVATSLFEQDGANRRECIEDLTWALMNTPEFVFKD